MIDSHCHLDLPAFAADAEVVCQAAVAAGVTQIHIPGTTAKGWGRQFFLRQAAPSGLNIDVSLGFHPYFLPTEIDSAMHTLEQTLLANRDEVCAVGEIGLDAVIDVDVTRQEAFFLAQLRLAKRYDLPVIVHHRKTHHRLVGLIKQVGFSNGGIIHAFSGSKEVAIDYIQLGFALGVGGTITYPRAAKTRSTLAQVPLAHLVLETDSPDMPLLGFQGQRNEPQKLPLVAQALAQLHNVSLNEIAVHTSETYQRVVHRHRATK